MLQLLGPSTGGIRRHVEYITACLRERTWDVEVAGPDGVLPASAGPTHVVAVPARPHPVGMARARQALIPLLSGVDIVHAHGLKVGWLAASIRRRPPLVLTVHNVVLAEVDGRLAPPLRLLESALSRRVDHLVAVSDEIATRFSRSGAPMSVIPPAGPPPVPHTDPGAVRAGLGISADAPLLVSVARLHPQKDLPTLLRAVARARQRIPDLRALIVGTGPDADRVLALARDLGLAAPVNGGPPAIFLPSHPNTADLMAAADVVAVSSCWESGPLVLSEAALLGRPLVTTPVGFAPRIVADGVSGRIVPIGDDAAMAAAIVDLVSDRETARRLGTAARDAAAALSSDALVAGIEAVYRATLAR